MPKRICVLGASGYLGRFVTEALTKRGDLVTPLSSKEANLLNPSSLDHLKEPFDQIYHLATYIQAGDWPMHHQAEVWLHNQQIHTTVLSFWQRLQPQAKMIAIGTSCAYDPAYPLSEQWYLHGKPIDSLLTYGMSKKMLLAGLQGLHDQYGMDFLYLIPSTLYGPNYHDDGRQWHFIFDLMRKILRGKLYNEPVVLWGNGHQKREIIHIEDFTDVMLHLAEKAHNEVINIGSGKERSIREFASIISDCIGYDPTQIQYDLSRYTGATSKVLLIDKLRKMVPEFAPRREDVGIEETLRWMHTQLLQRV